MTPVRVRLMAWILDLYVGRHVSRNCDDLTWPAWFPPDERELLVREMERWNSSDPVTVEESVRMYASGNDAPPAWFIAGYLCSLVGQ